MIYKRLHEFRPSIRPVHDGDFVEAVVSDEARFSEGELEELRAKVAKLTEIVGKLFLYLPTDRAKREIAESLAWEAKPDR